MLRFKDLQKQYEKINTRILPKIASVLREGQYILGEEVRAFENLLVDKTGSDIAVTCGSGTDALIIALMSENIGHGDAVFLPSFTYNATANAVLLTGATPIFVDVSLNDYIIDIEELKRSILETKESRQLTLRAIIAVDIFGIPAPYPELISLAAEHNLTLIADAAQSFGATLHGKSVGSICPLTTTSFFPSKALGSYGDGGALFAYGHDSITTEKYSRMWHSIQYQGTDIHRIESTCIGLNSRLDTIQATILIEKFNIFYEELERCREISILYNERLQGIVDLPTYQEGYGSNFSYYTICTRNRDKVYESLLANKIPSAIYYKIPLHKMRAFKVDKTEKPLPVCEYLSQHIISLPIHAYLSDDDVNHIADIFIHSVQNADKIKL